MVSFLLRNSRPKREFPEYRGAQERYETYKNMAEQAESSPSLPLEGAPRGVCTPSHSLPAKQPVDILTTPNQHQIPSLVFEKAASSTKVQTSEVTNSAPRVPSYIAPGIKRRQ